MAIKILTLGLLTLAALAVASTTRPTTAPACASNIYPPDGKIDALLGRRLTAVHLRQISLEEAIERLRSESGANLFVDWHALRAANVDRSSKVDVDLRDVPLAQALELTLRSTLRETTAQLSWDVQDNVIVISSEGATGQNGSVRVYDVRDLMESEFAKQRARWASWVKEHGLPSVTNAQAVQTIGDPTWDELAQTVIRIIVDQVAEDTWKDNGGTIGSIHELNGRLIVRQTWQNHRRVEALLDELRAKGLPATGPSAGTSRPAGGSQ